MITIVVYATGRIPKRWPYSAVQSRSCEIGKHKYGRYNSIYFALRTTGTYECLKGLQNMRQVFEEE